MNPVLKSLALCSFLCVSSMMAVGQGTTCAADGDASRGSVIGCVTGEGVEIKPAADTAQSSEVLPLTPEQRPAMPPTVIFENGKLTIIANNASLGDILRIVGEKTGAVIDIPDSASERVVSKLGPGPARDVVASLLNGSHFNYVMLGNETDANAVARVVLTAKTDHADGTSAPSGQPTVATIARPMITPRTALQKALVQPYQEMLQQAAAQQIPTPDFQQPPLPAAEETPAPAPQNQAAVTGEGGSAPSAGASAAPAGPTGTETAAVEAPAPADPNANAERTPQQMLQNLYDTRRQMMVQQQQQQQQRQPAQQPQQP